MSTAAQCSETGVVGILAVSSLLDVGECCDEVLEDLGGDHDGVAISADVLGDLDHLAPGIFLEIEEENLAVGEDLFGMKDFLIHRFEPTL